MYAVFVDTTSEDDYGVCLWFLGIYDNEEVAKAHASAYKQSDIFEVETNHTYMPWTEDGYCVGEYFE